MKTYEITFKGRKIRERGAFRTIRVQRFGADERSAIANLYDVYEHIQQPQCREIPSPFDAEYLRRVIHNNHPDFDAFSRRLDLLKETVRHVAERAAKENARWHDDPESPDHWLYHAPFEMQFPAPVQFEALVEMALYLLRETPAGRELGEKLYLKEEKEQ